MPHTTANGSTYVTSNSLLVRSSSITNGVSWLLPPGERRGESVTGITRLRHAVAKVHQGAPTLASVALEPICQQFKTRRHRLPPTVQLCAGRHGASVDPATQCVR